MARASPLFVYVLTRAFLAVPMLIILLTAVFVILRLIPGDPIQALFGGRGRPDVVAAARAQLGLDRPLIVQYFDYLGRVFTGNFGQSLTLHPGQSVLHWILLVFPATLELAIYSMLVAAGVGVLTGVVAGRHRDTAVDVTLRMYGIVVWVIPIFWLGLMLQLIFAVGLRWLPHNDRLSPLMPIPTRTTGLYTIDSLLMGRFDIFIDAVRHLILPCVTLGLVLSGFFTRIVRVNMMQTLQSDFVEAARARGIRERSVVYRHAFRNALIPVVTVVGLQFAALLGGAILTETTFSLNGVGQELVRAIIAGDYTMVQGIIVFYATLVIGVSLLVDIANAFIDPRIKY
jgi:peptide/nickel transport system permease protein